MALYNLPAPEAAQRCLETALLLSAAPIAPPAGDGRPQHDPKRSLPLYQLEPAGGARFRPRLTGWRFALDGGSGQPQAAETTLTADGWVFSQFVTGPYVVSAARALRQAQNLVTAFQPRLLSVPRLYTMALWLHAEVEATADTGEPGHDDLLVPLAPAPPGIAAYQPLPAEMLLRLLGDRPTGPGRRRRLPPRERAGS